MRKTSRAFIRIHIVVYGLSLHSCLCQSYWLASPLEYRERERESGCVFAQLHIHYNQSHAQMTLANIPPDLSDESPAAMGCWRWGVGIDVPRL